MCEEHDLVRGILVRNWWIVAARGGVIAALAVALSGASAGDAQALAIAFGMCALFDGALGAITVLIGTTPGREPKDLVAQGLVGLGAGAIALTLWPSSIVTVAWLIAAWALSAGTLELIAAVRVRGLSSSPRIALAVAGYVALALGASCLAIPDALYLLVPATFFALGTLRAITGFRLRVLAGRVRIPVNP